MLINYLRVDVIFTICDVATAAAGNAGFCTLLTVEAGFGGTDDTDVVELGTGGGGLTLLP